MHAVHAEMEIACYPMRKWALLWRGHVFLNHTVRIREKLTEESLRRAFNRGAAILPPANS